MKKSDMGVFTLINRRSKNRLKFILHGHHLLEKSNQLDLLHTLQDTLTKTQLNNVRLPKVCHKGGFDVELSTRQYLKIKFLSSKLNKAILYSIGSGKPLRYSLPKEWRQILIKKNIKVDNFSCVMLWQWNVFLLWGYAVLQGLKSIYYLLLKQKELGCCVYFDGLAKNNFSTNNKTHNIINWYLQWNNKAKDIDSIVHSVTAVKNYSHQDLKIIYTDGLPSLSGIQIVKYIFWCGYLTLHSLLFIFKKPYFALFLGEIFKLIRVRVASEKQIPKDCLFHNSNSYYRPLWTYEAQRKGARILFYFYSTNNENFKTKKKHPIENPWHLISWSHYLVWDKYQADFIRRFNDDATIERVGVIWFFSMGVDIPSLSKKSFAIFDVTAFKDDVYIASPALYDFYWLEFVNQFLNDIYLVLLESNYIMIHKMKRINPFAHPQYVDNIEILKEKSNYLAVNPSLDAMQLIQKTEGCISIPFTSTAIIAKQEGKPSIYYDPSGVIQKDDRAAHGIPVLSGIEELKKWVKNIE